MKRNWELVRKILLRLEEVSHLRVESVSSDSFEGYDSLTVSYHMELLHYAGLIKAPHFSIDKRAHIRYGALVDLGWSGTPQ